MAITLIPLLSYSFVNSITPGPNNIMLASSGVNFGFRRTVPHFLGVYFGFLFMLSIACLGFGQIFEYIPLLQPILKYVGSAYLLYLAYRIATAGSLNDSKVGKPIRFFEAALFQYVNPKAWIIAGTMPSAFTTEPGLSLADGITLVAMHGIVSFPCVLLWAIMGTQLRHFLKSEKSRRIFSFGMASLLVATVAGILVS